jgi:hypothetical protein
MSSPFAKSPDFAVAAHFRKDSGGRTLFLPLITKREAYFVDSPSDEKNCAREKSTQPHETAK